MSEQDSINYLRVAKAIDFMKSNYQNQPNLDDIARHVHLSPFHFQRLFKEWAGVSPKKFLQFISVSHARRILQKGQSTLFDAAAEVGLSGTGRLHDLFITIEAMTPADFKHGGRDLTITWSTFSSMFGSGIIASTSKGICYMAFASSHESAVENIQSRYPHANLVEGYAHQHDAALALLANDWSRLDTIKLHLSGSEFQLKVWEALLTIPMGDLTTYGAVARQIGSAQASRAVGTAIGCNPVAFLIPCYRVIQSTGALGGYMWGETRKSALIGWEQCRIENLHTG